MSECERKERFDGQTIIPPLWSKYTHQRCRKEQLDCSLIVGQGQIVRRVAWKTRRDQINLPVGPSSEPQQERVRVEVGGRTRRRWKTEGRRWTGEVGIDSNYRASWEALIAYGHFRLFFFTFFFSSPSSSLWRLGRKTSNISFSWTRCQPRLVVLSKTCRVSFESV